MMLQRPKSLVMTTKVTLALTNLPKSHFRRRELPITHNLSRKVHVCIKLGARKTLRRKRRTHHGWVWLHQRMRKASKAIQVRKTRGIRQRYLGGLLPNCHLKIMLR
jgi:hypothetical protein